MSCCGSEVREAFLQGGYLPGGCWGGQPSDNAQSRITSDYEVTMFHVKHRNGDGVRRKQ